MGISRVNFEAHTPTQYTHTHTHTHNWQTYWVWAAKFRLLFSPLCGQVVFSLSWFRFWFWFRFRWMFIVFGKSKSTSRSWNWSWSCGWGECMTSAGNGIRSGITVEMFNSSCRCGCRWRCRRKLFSLDLMNTLSQKVFLFAKEVKLDFI